MVEDIKTAHARLKQRSELQKFLEEHPKAFLASFSLMGPPGEIEAGFWQIDYYMKDKNRMTSFVMAEQIGVKPNQEVLKLSEIKKLDIDKIKVGFEAALEKAKAVFSEKTNEPAQSIIVILQNTLHQDNFQSLWVITFVTASMKMIGIKIDAMTGKVVDEKTGSFGYKVEKT